jgi:hypothetical protein
MREGKRSLVKTLLSVLILGLALTGSEATRAEVELSGTYIYFQETVSKTKMPILADVVARTRAISVQTLKHDKNWLRGTGDLCDVQMTTSSSLVKTELPPAFRKAIAKVRTNARLRREGERLDYYQPEQTLVLGAELDDPETEQLPNRPDDPRVIDSDKDGKPGVTVSVSGIVSGDIYLVQRSTSTLRGTATPGGFVGKITFTNEQRVLGATSKVLKRDPDAQPDPSRSRFRLHKVADGITCTEARRIARDW